MEADDETVYTTSRPDEEEFLVVTEFGPVNFYNEEVSNETSELFGEVNGNND